MKRQIIETREFQKLIDVLLKKRRLLRDSYEEFKKDLVTYPEKGDRITGTGGVRKARLESSSAGKSGGFRVCYYYLMRNERIYLLYVFAKNEKDNLTMQEKKILKEYVYFLKGAQNG